MINDFKIYTVYEIAEHLNTNI